MRVFIGLAIVAICIFFFGWWGLISLLVALPFIGWKDRHKGPLPTKQRQAGTTDYSDAQDIASETPKSFRQMQDIAVKASKKATTADDLLTMLNQLLYNLRTEKPHEDDSPDRELLQDFLGQFSTAFPNWKGEYAILSDLIDDNY